MPAIVPRRAAEGEQGVGSAAVHGTWAPGDAPFAPNPLP